MADQHEHRYGWRLSPEGASWYVGAECDCGDVIWACTATDTPDFHVTLKRAFTLKDLDALGYFTAPTMLPPTMTPEVVEWLGQA